VNALSISGLSKTYGDSVHALKGIDLNVPEGDFFALLGPNGAGKSTAIGIISALVNKTHGSVKVFDHDIDEAPEAAKASIGLVPQEFNFNKSPSRELSGGMKRRLMIARALIHEPKLLILDEPTAGVDLEIRRSMWSFLKELNEQHGTTIILTTHYLEEAEALCRNVAIIDGGEIIEQGAVAQLLSRSMLETFVLDTEGYTKPLMQIGPFTLRERDGNSIEVDVPKGHTINELFSELTEKGIYVSSLRNKTNRLEEFFLRLVQRKTGESA